MLSCVNNREASGFNSRSPHGEHSNFFESTLHRIMFQFTPPRWGALCRYLGRLLTGQFQFTLPMWGAFDKSYSYYSCFDVSIHAPVWGTRKLAVVDSRLKKFQLFYVNSTFVHFAVSIHVLRIVSTSDSGKCCYAIAFQFILSRMESTSPMAMQQILTWFQFTLPAWVAHYFDKCVSRSDVFQFTLPVWGAFTPLPCTTFIIKFQFTLPWRERWLYPAWGTLQWSFQFTLP